MKPSLPTTGTYSPEFYLNDDNFAVQQKMDGMRLVTEIKDGKVKGWSRNGHLVNMPGKLERALAGLHGEWSFDGELLLDKTYYVFDILTMPGNSLVDQPWITRQRVLTKLLSATKIPGVQLVPYHISHENKVAYYNLANKMNIEGVIFKDTRKPYRSGRHSNFIKYKFVKTIDCVVMDAGFEGRDNFTLGLYDDGLLVDVGRVSALTGDGAKLEIGDVVEVHCLYVTDENRLYQPTKPMLRNDKMPWECTWDQLEPLKTDRRVIEVELGNGVE